MCTGLSVLVQTLACGSVSVCACICVCVQSSRTTHSGSLPAPCPSSTSMLSPNSSCMRLTALSINECVLDQEKRPPGDPCIRSLSPHPLCCVTRMGGRGLLSHSFHNMLFPRGLRLQALNGVPVRTPWASPGSTPAPVHPVGPV